MSGIPAGVSQAFMIKQAEIQRKLESEVSEIKKIESGNDIYSLNTNFCRIC